MPGGPNHQIRSGSLVLYVGLTKRHERFQHGLVWLVCAGMLAGIGWTGTSCLRQHGQDEARPLTDAEADRLAQVRLHNFESGPVAMSLRLPDEAGGGGLTGQVDWSQPLINVATSRAGESKPDGLIQAVPGLIASHDAISAADPAALPEQGWTVRRTRADSAGTADARQTATDIVLSAVLTLSSMKAADPQRLRAKSKWLRQASIDGATVDVFRAPLMLDTVLLDQAADKAAGKSDVPEAVFWVDRDGALRRLQLDPAGTGLATADFLLEQRDVASVEPISLLGGHPNDPRELNDDEAASLAGLRQRNSLTGATVDIELPVGDDEMIRAEGYLDWRVPMVYLAVDAPGKENDGLMCAMAAGAATRAGKVDGLPPQTPPTDGWATQAWSDRVDGDKASDLDTLLFKLMVMASPAPDDLEAVKKDAAWLREDAIGKTDTAVLEFPIAGDKQADKPGMAPFRYWVDTSDQSLRRVELRTDGLGMAHADLAPQEPPAIQIPGEVVSALTTTR